MQMNILVGMLSTLLSSDGVVKADELAEEFEISKRTVYRYIDVLSAGGIPIQSHFGRGGGWTILENYKLKSTFFTKEEYERVLFCLQSFSVQDATMRNVVSKLQGLHRTNKTATILRSEQLIVDSQDMDGKDAMAVFSDCIATKKTCKIEYHSRTGEDSIRTVEPYCLILKDNIWYVYCYCCLRRAFRYFRISRIVKLEVGNNFVGRPYHVDSSVIQTDVLRNKEMCEVILSVEPMALAECEEWLGVKSVAKVGDSYLAKKTLPYDEVLINKVLSLGVGVRVEKPQKLRQEVLNRCQRIIQMNTED